MAADPTATTPDPAAPGAGGEKVDGRRARRERNREAVVDAVLAMFQEELLVPTIEKAAERSGLSLRSVYRYFPDPESLLDAAIERQMRRVVPLFHIHRIGEGPLDQRLETFVDLRIRIHDQIGASYRATLHHEPNIPKVRDRLHAARRMMAEQFERQFAPELDALPARVRLQRACAGDLLSQLDSIDVLRRSRRLTVAETRTVLRGSLRTLLTAPA